MSFFWFQTDVTLDHQKVVERTEWAEQFYRAGGQLSLPDWAALPPEDRAAALLASRKVETERLMKLAAILRGNPLEEAEVLADVDGGDAFHHQLLVSAVAKAAGRTT